MFITVATGISGFQMLGSGINPLDLAPRYADILCAFGNLWASMGGVAAPYVAATLTVRLCLFLFVYVVNLHSYFVQDSLLSQYLILEVTNWTLLLLLSSNVCLVHTQ